MQIRLFSPFVGFYCRFSSGKPNFKKHEICIKTCGNLYQKWREERRFRNLPDGDLKFKITYFDNGNSFLKDKNSVPVIVAIHGAPGSYKDFVGLSSYFEQKARVIIPNFPGKYNFLDATWLSKLMSCRYFMCYLFFTILKLKYLILK